MRPSSPRILLQYAKTPAFLVTNLTNIRYLTGAEVSAGAVLITPRQTLLFVDSRYHEVAISVTTGCLVRPMDDLAKMLRRVAVCGCEAETVTLAQGDRWRKEFRSTRFFPKHGVIGHFRRAKDHEERKRFRRAQQITRELLKRVPSALRDRVTEREIAWKLRAWASELNADHLAFDPIVAFGPHTSSPHHHPTTHALKKGDIVQIDVGARFEGYCADQSAVFFTDKKTQEQEHALAAVQEAKQEAERMVRAGASTHALDRLARSILRKHGVEKAFSHSLGHGVGLEIHEGVTLSQKRPDEVLLASEIVTIEPGVYFPGKFGIRLEDEIIVGE
ncbi:MAG: M24 family metallopeptidase [Candidatus Peribacteraceae bacterium]|nr:M24 family metallopeptidase [Candidatus Peribacteraceae bacterium]MDD5739215.1 M24 family metallopeptidase [Candidatus Peribacteraceae bacterium]